MLKLQEVPRRILTVEEFRQLVESMDRPEIAALVAIRGRRAFGKSAESLGNVRKNNTIAAD